VLVEELDPVLSVPLDDLLLRKVKDGQEIHQRDVVLDLEVKPLIGPITRSLNNFKSKKLLIVLLD
jgi:hypothetical protein